MDISVTGNNILAQATKAYNGFESCQFPFAAVKLIVMLQNASRKEIDQVVEDNFRSEKDLVFKEDKNYNILMKRTTIEAAERAVNRLKAAVGHIIARKCENQQNNCQVRASAYIFGYSSGTKKMHIKFLDLRPNINIYPFDKKAPKIPFGYREYLRCCELLKAETLKINQMINLVV